MLLMQNLDNLPRKFAYRRLLELGQAGRVGIKGPDTNKLLKGWALNVNLEIPNDVPAVMTLMEVCAASSMLE